MIIATIIATAMAIAIVAANFVERNRDPLVRRWPTGPRSICFGWPLVSFCQKEPRELTTAVVNEDYVAGDEAPVHRPTWPVRRWIAHDQPITRISAGKLAANLVALSVIVFSTAVMAHRWARNAFRVSLLAVFVWITSVAAILAGTLKSASANEVFWNGRSTLGWFDVLHMSVVAVGCACTLYFVVSLAWQARQWMRGDKFRSALT